jgi:uncharacterized membrane protein
MDPSIALASRLLGTLVFGCAALGKLRHYTEFVGVVAHYRLLPAVVSTPVAQIVIGLELFVGAGLIIPTTTLAAAGCALVLLAVFIVAMSINLARGRVEIDCGCFQSALRQRLSAGLVVRNLVLMLLLSPVLIGPAAPAENALLPGSGLQILDGLAAGVLAFILYQVLGQLLALARPGRSA